MFELGIILPYFMFLLITAAIVTAGVVVVAKAQKFTKAFGVLIIAGGMMFCCVSWYFGTDIYQAFRLPQFSKAFNQMSHPPNTTHIDSYQGYPHYAANWCAYFVGELREYSGERQEIVEFYRKQDPPSRLQDGAMYILFVGEKSFEPTFPIYDEINWRYQEEAVKEAVEWSWELSATDLQDRSCYIVYFAYIGDYYFDYRCH